MTWLVVVRWIRPILCEMGLQSWCGVIFVCWCDNFNFLILTSVTNMKWTCSQPVCLFTVWHVNITSWGFPPCMPILTLSNALNLVKKFLFIKSLQGAGEDYCKHSYHRENLISVKCMHFSIIVVSCVPAGDLFSLLGQIVWVKKVYRPKYRCSWW